MKAFKIETNIAPQTRFSPELTETNSAPKANPEPENLFLDNGPPAASPPPKLEIPSGSASKKLAFLTEHLSNPENQFSADDLQKIQKHADKAYANRGTLSKLRDLFSRFFGKSDATKAHENFTQQFSSINDIEKAFGSGVTLTDEQKKQWVSLLYTLPSDKRTEIISQLKQVLSSPPDEAGVKLAFASQSLLQGANKAEIDPDDPRFKMAQKLLNGLQEKISLNTFNTQFKHEYLPRQFMTEAERKTDGELMREHLPLDNFRAFADALPATDPRKITFEQMLKAAEGFQRGDNMEIAFGGGGVPAEVSTARLYGIKRTPEGFTSVLGLGQGDRHAVGMDVMPWAHETTQAQNAAIMKVLRETEKPADANERESYFESAYKTHGQILDPAQKEELKKAVLAFADARGKRLEDQLAQVNKKKT